MEAMAVVMLSGCEGASGGDGRADAAHGAEIRGSQPLAPADDAPLSTYVDPQSSFSIALPAGWNAAPDLPGIGFRDPASGATLRLFRAAHFDDAVEIIQRDKKIIAHARRIGDYRALAQRRSGDLVRIRILATKTGAAVAKIEYSKARANMLLDATAETALASLVALD